MQISILVFRLCFLAAGVLCNVVLIFYFQDISPLIFYSYTALYLCFAILMVTPLADNWIDLSIGTRTPTRKELTQLQEIQRQLEQSANDHDKPFPKKIRLRVITDNYQNAMAFGHRSVGLTSGLLKTGTHEQIRAIFAHEVGHLINKDTTFNTFVAAAFGPILWLGIVIGNLTLILFMTGNPIMMLMALVVGILMLPPVIALLIYYLFNSAASFMSRPIEYAADAYAMELTRDEGLLSWFEVMEAMDVSPSGRFLAAYQASHPPIALREDRARMVLENLS